MTEPPWIIAALCLIAVLVLLILNAHLHARIFTLEIRVTKLWRNFSHLARDHDEITADLDQLPLSSKKKRKK
jgi:hypothetical protein